MPRQTDRIGSAGLQTPDGGPASPADKRSGDGGEQHGVEKGAAPIVKRHNASDRQVSRGEGEQRLDEQAGDDDRESGQADLVIGRLGVRVLPYSGSGAINI